jgi:DNA topoisomerase-1
MPPKKSYPNKKEISFSKDDATWLLILESPSKCSKIEGFLGSQYKCIASNGHIRSLDGTSDTPKFSVIPTKKAHVSQMRKIINEFPKTNIILATDDDREGEAIAWHICDTFGLPVETTHRIIFHEITETAIRKAIQDKRIIDIDLVYTQIARQTLDMIIGFRISPVLWKYAGTMPCEKPSYRTHVYKGSTTNTKKGLSAGRCQTPALRLVYDNEQDAMGTTQSLAQTQEKGGAYGGRSPRITHKLIARFFPKNIEFHLSGELTDDTIYEFLQKSIDFRHIFSIGSPKDVAKHPPIPLNTSRLLQVASSQLHLSPKDTMSLCQVLYQDGHITYMRTENIKYSKDFLDITRSHITSIYGEPYVGKLDSLENKNGNNPHEAIRVTHLDVTGLSKPYEGKIVALYKLIWTTTLESCMSDFRANTVECRICAPDELHYSHSIEIPVFSGWKKLSQTCASSDEANGLLFYMKSLKDTEVQYNKIESHIAFHNIHSHYTESGLIKKLEELGIGRPSTFASIVDTIQERGYVKKRDIEGSKFSCTEYKLENGNIERHDVEKVAGNEKDKLVIEPIGITIIEFLIEHYSELFSYGYTSNMETKLDLVSQSNWYTICSECEDVIAGAAAQPTAGAAAPRTPPANINIAVEDVNIDTIAPAYIDTIAPAYINTLDDTGGVRGAEPPQTQTHLRILNEDFSVRKGKYGPYVYYKRKNMKKPEFYNIKKFKESFTYCNPEVLINWVRETYKIKN